MSYSFLNANFIVRPVFYVSPDITLTGKTKIKSLYNLYNLRYRINLSKSIIVLINYYTF